MRGHWKRLAGISLNKTAKINEKTVAGSGVNANLSGMRIRILVAHPDLAKSKANQALLNGVKEIPDTEIVDLMSLAVAGRFDVAAELDVLRRTDVLVWQFPLYWYSAPGILREWQDQVLTQAVYGPDKVLEGKRLLVATTVGAAASTYRSGDLNQYTLDEMLRPFEACARSARMQWLPSFSVFEVDKLTVDDWQREGARYKTVLQSIT